jgi:hypothetical protein
VQVQSEPSGRSPETPENEGVIPGGAAAGTTPAAQVAGGLVLPGGRRAIDLIAAGHGPRLLAAAPFEFTGVCSVCGELVAGPAGTLHAACTPDLCCFCRAPLDVAKTWKIIDGGKRFAHLACAAQARVPLPAPERPAIACVIVALPSGRWRATISTADGKRTVGINSGDRRAVLAFVAARMVQFADGGAA